MCALNVFSRSIPTLIIDCHAILHAVRHAQYHRGDLAVKDWSLIGGFINAINSISYRFGSGNIVFAWDSSSSFRKDRYPFYKDRKSAKIQNEEEKEIDRHHFKQFAIIRDEIIPTIGFVHNHRYEGFEADDIIAATVMNNSRSMIIVSSDEDLYQLLDYAPMYIYRKKALFSAQAFRMAYGIEPKDWWKVKAVAGCSSDCVPGVPGIGETYAIRYLKGELKGARLEKIINNKAKIDENEWLVKLPLQVDPPCPIPDLNYEEGPRSMNGFISVITKYDVHGFTPDRLENVASRWRLK